MIDTIKPMGLDLSKDLHGHVRVELRDRWTGRVVDSQEKDNLVTNALTKIYKMAKGANSPLWNWFTPIYSKALGGILLFDSQLTESANNILFPGSAKLTAFAGQGANNDNPKCGSLNAQESVEGASSYTTVWDFSTSQANGVVASLARTSYHFENMAFGGNGVWAKENVGPFTWGSDGAIQSLGYDAANKYLYLALSSQQTYKGTLYTTDKIYRASVDFETQFLTTQYYIPTPDKWTEVISVSSSTDGTSSAAVVTYDPYSNNFYYASGSSLHLIAMNGTRSTITLPTAVLYSVTMVATADYYWYTGSDRKIYQVSKTTPADVSSVTLTFAAEYLIALSDNAIATAPVGYTVMDYALVYEDMSTEYFSTSISSNSVLSGNLASGTTPAMFLGIYMATAPYYRYSNYSFARQPLYLNTCYLGTIANLDSPVTKSSSQTMKIIYTLTEA